MKRYIRTSEVSEHKQDYNIMGLGIVDSRAQQYLRTLPSWVEDNILKFTAKPAGRGNWTRYALVVEPLESDPDRRPIIIVTNSIADVRNQIAEYENSYSGVDRYIDDGYPMMI